MTVRCDGDSRVMELVGEKQDFEAELSRFGFRHEDFSLCVRRARAQGRESSWISNYAVQVTNVASRKCNVYWGGPRENWVAQFVLDLVNGLYGEPSQIRLAPDPSQLDAA
jgi:hypothetical protein